MFGKEFSAATTSCAFGAPCGSSGCTDPGGCLARLHGCNRRGLDILWIDDTAGKLGTVDMSTHAVKVIGSAGNSVVLTDIAFDPNGNLWGIDANHFYSVNKTTGHATLIGTTGLTSGNGIAFGSNGTGGGALCHQLSRQHHDLSVHHQSDDRRREGDVGQHWIPFGR